MSNLDDVIGMTGSVASGGATQAPAAGDASTQSQFISTLFNQLVQSTRLAHELPDADDHKYFVSTSPEYVTKSTAVQNQLLNLLGLISDAIVHKDEASLTRNKRSGATVPTSTLYTSKTDTLDRFHTLSDTVDTALESVDLCLDAHRGVKRGNTAMETGSATIRSARGNNQFHSSATMLKPQRSFQHLIDNSSRTWIPILPNKPNAMKPLPDYDKLRREREEKGTSSSTSRSDDGMGDDEDDQTHAVIAKGSPSPKLSAAMTSHIASLGMSTEAKSPTASIYPHPYKYEIENMDWEAVRSRQLVATKEQLFQPLSKVQCLWVDDLKALEELVEDLENVTEIAIDLEHHSFRSYAGLTCLMQISTRKTDYLIDTLALRTELHRLNTSFTDPKIVKVLHGADSDIIWLQRDLGLYVVNLFDTGQAARVLEFQSFGLSYLLKHFCDVSTDKKYQLADWRIRPLSAEMLLYARMDTHYLLYIYDRLKNDLIARSKPEQNQFSPIQGVPYLLAQVLERSKQISLKTYEKEDQASMNSAMEFAFKMGVILQNDVQSRILVALFKLRDELARKEDESVFYMCSNPNLLQIIQNVPSDIQQLEAVCNKPVPPMVKNHGPLILQTINEARGTGATTFTSPFLASTLPQVTASPALGPMSTDGQDHGIGMAPPAMQTPQKASKGGLFGNNKPNLTAGGGLHPTPATQTSALFAQLSTSTPQHSNSGWVSQAIHDAAASSSSSISAASQSPVMTTDQLYSSANWIHASKTLERSLAAVKGSPIAHSSTSISIPLFDDSGNSPRRNSAIGFQALPSPVAKPSPFALLASSGPAESLENRLAMAQAYSALAQATNSSSALSSITHHTPAKPTKPSVPPSTHDAMDLDDDSSVLRTPNTGEPAHSFVSPSPMSLQVVPSPVMPPATGFTSISPSLQQESDESADVSSSPLPKSMREIYKISNENRRKKKKVKTVAGGPPSSMEEEEDSVPSSAADARKDSKKGNSTSNAGGVDRSSSQFMKTIGWGGASGTPPIHTSQPSNAAAQLLTNQNTTNTSDFKRKPNSAPPSGSASLSSSPPSNSPTFHSFDYSHATLPPSNPSAQPFFNPYQDIGRDKNELKAAAGTSGPATAANKIYKGHTQLKNQGKSVTVVHDNFQQRQRGASASSGIPIQRQQQQQRR